MVFRYKCLSEDGRTITGVIDASDISSAISELKKMFSVVLEVKEEKRALRGKKVDRKDLISFTNILSICVNAGLPIIKSLELAGGNVKNQSFRNVIEVMISSIRGGKLLSEAMSMHPGVFDDLYVGVIKAGESSGELGKALNSISGYLEKSYNIASKIKSALVYPTIILVVAVGVVFIFLTSIVPRFSEIYSSYSAELPQITQVTIAIGNFVRDNIILILSLMIGLGFFLFYSYRRFEKFRELVHRFIIRFLTPLGNFLVKSDVEKFARVMSIMVSNKVMILSALETVVNVVNLIPVKRAVEYAISEVEKGRLISDVLSEYRFLPQLFVQMVRVGEETGEIDKTLYKLAEFYSFDLERQSEILVSSLSPILIVIVGLIVAFLVLSLFMPMFTLQQMIIR